VRTGHYDQAAAHAQRMLELVAEIDDRVFVVNAQRTLGFLELSLGDAAAATRRLEPLPALAAALGDREPMIYQMHGDVVEAHALTGGIDAARRVHEELEEFAHAHPWVQGTALCCRGLIRGAEGDNEAALADLGAAQARLEHSGQPLEPARALLSLGVAYRRAKRRGAAREALVAARQRFAALGADLWVERAEAEIARLGGRRTSDRDELTETERRIAELAAEGRLNRDIAATLFVSERTVEANLTRAYRKLGVRSRTELARRLP
jgi:DNA-binding CsgD family transcriptional regulator